MVCIPEHVLWHKILEALASNVLVLLVFVIAEVVGNSSIE